MYSLLSNDKMTVHNYDVRFIKNGSVHLKIWFSRNVTFSNIISNTKNKLHFSQFERIETDPSDTRLARNTRPVQGGVSGRSSVEAHHRSIVV